MAKPARTWLAVIVCVIAVIPAHVVAGVAEYLFRFIMASQGFPDPFGLYFLFGIDWLAKPLAWIFDVGLASALRGGIAGAVAVVVTKLLCRRANILKAAFITGTAYTVLVALMIVVSLFAWSVGAAEIAITGAAVATVLELIGLWIGLFSVAAAATAPPRGNVS
jgi:hypothetical protein